MHETQERGKDWVCGNLNRCHCISFNNLASISRCCTSRMHMYMSFCLDTMEQNNNIVVQVVVHTIDITRDGGSVACTPAKESRNNPDITLAYNILKFSIMTYTTSLTWLPQLHTFMTNTTNIRWRPIPTYVLHQYWATHAHTSLPHISLTYLNPPLLPSSSHLIRETSSPANQTCTHNLHTYIDRPIP
jgi:hypothetical protein